MRFTINLATRTYLDHRMLNRIAFAVIAVLVVISGWNVSRVATNAGEQMRLNTEIAAFQGRLGSKGGGVSEVESNRQKGHIRFYNEILERKSKSWLALLELFEKSTPEGISLASLAPGKNPEEWQLEGRARSFKGVQLYLEKLESSKRFSNVMLLSHKTITVGEKSIGVQFAINCKVLTQ